MKTINTLIWRILFSSLLLYCTSAIAQNKTNAIATSDFRVRVNSVVNGKATSLDTAFNTKDAMDAFLVKSNSQRSDLLPPVPPAPPAIPAPPRPPLPPSPPAPRPPLPDVKPGRGKVVIEQIFEEHEAPKVSRKKDSESNCLVELQAEIEAQQSIISNANQRVETLNAEIDKCSNRSDTPAFPSIGLMNNEENNVSDFSLSPNPGNGQFDIRFKAEKPVDISLKLIDINGREVYSESLSGFSGTFVKTLEISKDSKGFYLLELTSNRLRKVLRVMVQ